MLCKRMSLGAYRANHLFQKMLQHNVRASRPNRQPPVRQSVSSTMTRGGATLAPGQVYEPNVCTLFAPERRRRRSKNDSTERLRAE